MIILFLKLLLSLSAFSADYTLLQAENDHYQSYTRAELIHRLGPSQHLLPFYFCNGRDEVDLTWRALRQSPRGDSLKIKDPLTHESFIYSHQRLFSINGALVKPIEASFVSKVFNALLKIEQIPEGFKLLRELEFSYFPLMIALGGNMFNPQDAQGRNFKGIYQANALSIFSHGRMTSEDVTFRDIGAGGVILWSPKSMGDFSFVALGHELFHAFDSIRGVLDMRFVKGEMYEFVFVSEYRAVYFENLIRNAHQLPYRTHYGEDQNGPGMLDEQGRPRKMPSPCLKEYIKKSFQGHDQE